MAIDSTRLMGEVIQDPEGPGASEQRDKDVERLLFNLLHALIAEQAAERGAVSRLEEQR